jgi:hypothetical protein
MMTRPFHRQKHRTTPFPPDANPLNHAQNSQYYCTPDPDHLVGGHKGNQKGCDAHAQQGGDQGRFAADAVAEVAEYRSADRAADKADEVGAEGRERRGQWLLVGEVELTEDQPGRRAVNEKVVPFDRGADGRRDDRFAQLCAVVGRDSVSYVAVLTVMFPPAVSYSLRLQPTLSSNHSFSATALLRL